MPTTLTNSPNQYNKNRFKIFLSNVPNLTPITDEELDIATIQNNLRGITVPDLALVNLESFGPQEVQYHPNPVGAKSLNTFTLEYIADDKLLNWYIFYCWIVGSRAGKSCRKGLDGKDLLRDNCIDSCRIYMYDNNKNVQSKFEFKRCFLTSISSMDLKFGTSEHATFTLTFQYENFDFKLQNRLDSCDEETIDDTV